MVTSVPKAQAQAAIQGADAESPPSQSPGSIDAGAVADDDDNAADAELQDTNHVSDSDSEVDFDHWHDQEGGCSVRGSASSEMDAMSFGSNVTAGTCASDGNQSVASKQSMRSMRSMRSEMTATSKKSVERKLVLIPQGLLSRFLFELIYNPKISCDRDRYQIKRVLGPGMGEACAHNFLHDRTDGCGNEDMTDEDDEDDGDDEDGVTTTASVAVTSAPPVTSAPMPVPDFHGNTVDVVLPTTPRTGDRDNGAVAGVLQEEGATAATRKRESAKKSQRRPRKAGGDKKMPNRNAKAEYKRLYTGSLYGDMSSRSRKTSDAQMQWQLHCLISMHSTPLPSDIHTSSIEASLSRPVHRRFIRNPYEMVPIDKLQLPLIEQGWIAFEEWLITMEEGMRGFVLHSHRVQGIHSVPRLHLTTRPVDKQARKKLKKGHAFTGGAFRHGGEVTLHALKNMQPANMLHAVANAGFTPKAMKALASHPVGKAMAYAYFYSLGFFGSCRPYGLTVSVGGICCPVSAGPRQA